MSMMLVLNTKVRQLVAVPGKTSYGEEKARLVGSCITTHPCRDREAV